MRVAVLGHRGLVGSAIAARLRAVGVHVVGVDRTSYASARGTFDIVVNAAGSSDKRLAQVDPQTSLRENVGSVLAMLLDFPCELFVHVSSVSVYGDLSDPERTHESVAIDPDGLSPYGLHKLMAEWLVRRHARRWLVVRLGNVVGPGLRKNPIFDLLERRTLFVHPRSEMAFIDTRDVARIVWEIRSLAPGVINVAGRGTVELAEVAQQLGVTLVPPGGSMLIHERVNIDLLSRHVPVPHTTTTLANFIREWRGGNMARHD